MILVEGRRYKNKTTGEVAVIKELFETNCQGIEVVLKLELDGSTIQEKEVFFNHTWKETSLINNLMHKFKNFMENRHDRDFN